MSIGNPSFDLFQLPEEHQELRAAIRALAEKEIAPFAAEVDEQAARPALSSTAAAKARRRGVAAAKDERTVMAMLPEVNESEEPSTPGWRRSSRPSLAGPMPDGCSRRRRIRSRARCHAPHRNR